MIIAPLITNDYLSVNAYEGTRQVEKIISAQGGVLVVEDSKILGVITTHDLATCHHNLVIDCLTTKPVLSPQHLIPEVLAMMQEVHSDLLIVCQDDNLLGVIHKKNITDYLCRSVEQQNTLVHSIAHDLKNPLSNVLSVTSLLEDDGNNDGNKALIVMAQNACNYANGIINDLLFSQTNQSEPLQKQSWKINELLLDCVDSFKIMLLQKQVFLTSRLLPEDCFIKADQIKLKRAFCNLISNAIKFTPSGGNIIISAERQQDLLLISVKDSGIGIPENLQHQIFEKFTRAKRQGTDGENSTGLGMNITRQIIELHGGKIWFESLEQHGATFYVQIKL